MPHRTIPYVYWMVLCLASYEVYVGRFHGDDKKPGDPPEIISRNFELLRFMGFAIHAFALRTF